MDAAPVVENYQLTNDLYHVAYTALEKRYNNKRRLAQLYIGRILDFSKNSGSNTGNFQLFLTAHTTAVNAFKALQILRIIFFYKGVPKLTQDLILPPFVQRSVGNPERKRISQLTV